MLGPTIGDLGNLATGIKEAYARVSPGKDVVLVEGTWEADEAGYVILGALDARVIIVEAYSTGLPVAEMIDSGKKFGERLLGMIVNKVPQKRLGQAESELSPRFAEAGITVLGLFPEDRALASLTVGELAEHLKGDMLNALEEPAELVENYMLGALGVDAGLIYFGRKANKAVVARGERSDLQLAAMETSTRCLVISGNTAPNPTVLNRAEEKKVPIILAKEATSTTVTKIEDALSQVRFSQAKKLPIITGIMEQHFNFEALSQGLGLAG